MHVLLVWMGVGNYILQRCAGHCLNHLKCQRGYFAPVIAPFRLSIALYYVYDSQDRHYHHTDGYFTRCTDQKSIKRRYMFCFTWEMFILTLIKPQNSRKCSLLTCWIWHLGPIRLGIVHVIRFFSVNRYNSYTKRYENI